MLGWVELWLSWSFDKIISHDTQHITDTESTYWQALLYEQAPAKIEIKGEKLKLKKSNNK